MQRGCLQQLQQPPDLENSVILVLIFALLICNTAGSLASGLARSLALAATAVCNGLCNVLGFNGLNSAHGKPPFLSFSKEKTSFITELLYHASFALSIEFGKFSLHFIIIGIK